MKLSQILVVCFVALLCVDVQATKIKRTQRAILRAFAEGFMDALSGGHLKDCLANWASPAYVNDATSDTWLTKLSGAGNIAKAAITVIRTVTSILCGKFFGKLSDFIKDHVFRKRFFLERSWKSQTHRVKHMKRATNFISAIKNLRNIKDKIIGFFRTVKEYAEKIKELVKRALECGKAVWSIFNTVKNIITAITVLTASGGLYAGFWPVFVAKLICNWEGIVNAINYLVAAIQNKGDQRSLQFGKFVGTLLVIFGNVITPLNIPAAS